MMSMNRIKSLDVDEGVFSITTVTEKRYPYFRNRLFCEMFVEQIRLSKTIRNFRLYGFSIMPDHVHLMIHPDEGDNISRIMHYIKKHSSMNINRVIDCNRMPIKSYIHVDEDGYPRLKCIYDDFGRDPFEILLNLKQEKSWTNHTDLFAYSEIQMGKIFL